MAMLAAALAVHMVLGVAWMLSPSHKVNKIPVHVLNIKLGGGDGSAMTSLESGGNAEKTTVRRVIANPATPPLRENVRAKSPQPPLQKKPDAPRQEQPSADVTQKPATSDAVSVHTGGALSQSPNGQPSQYVRGGGGSAQGVAGGSALGNSVDPQADVMHRYTQLISMWINRHKAVLNRALQPGMKGNIVIRLRIDRLGNIQYFKLDKATGVPVVDAAAVEMVRAANPVPPVPSNYPGGNVFEFLIPVGYTFQK